jgi:hypothetical protein
VTLRELEKMGRSYEGMAIESSQGRYRISLGDTE